MRPTLRVGLHPPVRVRGYSTNNAREALLKSVMKEHGQVKVPRMQRRRAERETVRREIEARNKAASEAAAKLRLENVWDFKTTVVVERPEIVTPEQPKWLKDYITWKREWDKPILEQYPNILHLDEEFDKQRLRIAEEARHAEGIKMETEEERISRENKEARAARLVELKHEKIRKDLAAQIGPRFTKADQANDRKSLYRKLDEKLFLIVKKKRQENQWQFPNSVIGDSETFRSASERTLKSFAGEEMESFWIGNAPLHHFAYAYPENYMRKRKAYGAKPQLQVFISYTYYLNGPVKLGEGLVDYLWVTKPELKEYLAPSLLEAAEFALADVGVNTNIPRQHYLDGELPEILKQAE